MSRTSARFACGSLVLSLCLSVVLTAQTEAETTASSVVPDWSKGLRTLAFDEDLLADGVAYYLESGGDTQLTIEMQSRYRRVVSSTSRAGGYLIAPLDLDELGAEENPVIAGALRIPVSSLTSGTQLDGALAGPGGLDAANHPDLLFHIDRAKVEDRAAGEVPDSTTFRLAIEGTLGAKGKAVRVTLPVELSFFMTSDETFSRGIGDFARLEGEFTVPVADLGVSPRLASALGEQARVRLFLLFSTPDPERPLIPPTTADAFWLQSRYLTSLRDRGDALEAYQVGEQLLKAAWDDAASLSQFAVSAVFSAGDGRRFPNQARRAAERVVELGGDSPDPMAVNLLARLAAEAGNFVEAISLQERAIGLLSGRALSAKPTMDANLELYRQLAELRATASGG